MIDNRLQLLQRDRLPVTAAHVLPPRRMSHDRLNDVLGADLIADGLEGSTGIVERSLDAGGFGDSAEFHANPVRGAGQLAIVPQVVADKRTASGSEEDPVGVFGKFGIDADALNRLQCGDSFGPKGNEAGNFGLASLKSNHVADDVAAIHVGQVSIADASIDGQQEYGPSLLVGGDENISNVGRAEGSNACLPLRSAYDLLAWEIEFGSKSKGAVNVLVGEGPLRKSANCADIPLHGMRICSDNLFGLGVVPRTNVRSISLPVSRHDAESRAVIPEKVYCLLDAEDVILDGAPLQFSGSSLIFLGRDEQIAQVADAGEFVGYGFDDNASQMNGHLLVISLQGKLGLIERGEPLHLAADLGHPSFDMTSEFKGWSCGGVVGFVDHNPKHYETTVDFANTSVIFPRMKPIANPLFVGSNPTSASSENPIKQGFSIKSGVTSDKPEIPDTAPTDRGLGCGKLWWGDYTYFFQATHGGPIKIGRAIDPIQRFAAVQTGHPYELLIVGLMEGDCERELHRILDHFRMHGEWFDPLYPVVETIKKWLKRHYSDSFRENTACVSALKYLGWHHDISPKASESWKNPGRFFERKSFLRRYPIPKKSWGGPITFRSACDFITKLHRHHPKPQGCKFALAAMDGEKMVAVATAGRPVARKSDDGLTAEITRVCSDGTRNACSFIYGAMRRVLQAMGYQRILTFTLKSESGESLRGAGFEVTGETSGRSWSVPSRQRETKHELGTKVRWESTINPTPAASAPLQLTLDRRGFKLPGVRS